MHSTSALERAGGERLERRRAGSPRRCGSRGPRQARGARPCAPILARVARRSILLVAQLTPPSPLVGRAPPGRPGEVPEPARAPRDGAHVARVRNASVAGAERWCARATCCRAGSTGGAGTSTRSRAARSSRRAARARSSRSPCPTWRLAGWLPFALPRALALARGERFDCVITTSPPQSAHLVGLALRGRRAVGRRPARRLDVRPAARSLPDAGAAARRSVARSRRAGRADRVVAVTAADRGRPRAAARPRRRRHHERLRPRGGRAGRRGARRAADARPALARAHRPRRGVRPLAADVPRGRRGAARALAGSGRAAGGRVRGATTLEERELLADERLGGIARSVGVLERPRALGLQRGADSLLVLAQGASGAQRRDEQALRVPGRPPARARRGRGQRGGADRARHRQRPCRRGRRSGRDRRRRCGGSSAARCGRTARTSTASRGPRWRRASRPRSRRRSGEPLGEREQLRALALPGVARRGALDVRAQLGGRSGSRSRGRSRRRSTAGSPGRTWRPGRRPSRRRRAPAGRSHDGQPACR